MNNLVPHHLSDMFTHVSVVHDRVTRQVENNDLYINQINTNYMEKSLQYTGAYLWNNLPSNIRNSSTVNTFKRLCKNWIVSQRTPLHPCFILST
jgi:hypothetical protein